MILEMTPQFTADDHLTWKTLFSRQAPLRSEQLVPMFTRGLEQLQITGDRIPDLNQINKKLWALTGWRGIFVKGFEGPETFYQMLAEKTFPIGGFIRSAKDLAYTPEPDIFHDLYGHLPFYADPDYARFCEDFGRRGMRYLSSPTIAEEFQRLFWFSVEFGLLKTPQGLRIFGAGIASSFDECAYALSGKPQQQPFDIQKIRSRPFRIDILQDTLFILNSTADLYTCLDDFENKIENPTTPMREDL
jgi:phenylalanine-4-hydroxylase